MSSRRSTVRSGVESDKKSGDDLAESIQSAVSGAISSALAPVLYSLQGKVGAQGQWSAIGSARSSLLDGSDDDDNFQAPKKRKPQPLPSTFLKKVNIRQKTVKKKKTPLISYDRDIVCLTKQFVSKNGTVKIPRSAERLEYLCHHGLKGKIRLISTMTEEEIMDEIRSVFKLPFGDKDFSFDILQRSGGKSKSLVVPSLSSSYSWTASAVAGSSKSPVYILARSSIDFEDCLSSEESEAELPKVKLRRNDDEETIVIVDDKPDDLTSTERRRKSSLKAAETATTTRESTIDVYSAPSVSGSDWTESTGYRNYIDLIGDSDPEYDRNYSPTPPPRSPITPTGTNDVSLDTLLLCHKSNVLSSNPEDRIRITVRRKHIFEDTLHKLRNGIDITKHLRVTFIGEPAIDDGGPMREYMRLLLSSIISNNSLLCGDANSRFLRHNVIELSKKTYFYVGQALSMSLVHGGPAPAFFAEPVVDYILFGLEKVKVGISDVEDSTIKRRLQKLQDAEDLEHFKRLLASSEFDFRYECGISKPVSNIRDVEREGIISSLCLHYTILSAKAELDQMVEGLKSLGILTLFRNNPLIARQLLTQGTPKPLTSESLYDMFTPELSPPMSNCRDKEEAQLLNWANFLEFVDGVGVNGAVTVFSPEDEEHEVAISLSDILVFGTGAATEPPMGFQPKPKIAFSDRSRYLTANTCTNTIYLPREELGYNDFNYYAAFSVGNSAGFGQL